MEDERLRLEEMLANFNLADEVGAVSHIRTSGTHGDLTGTDLLPLSSFATLTATNGPNGY